MRTSASLLILLLLGMTLSGCIGGTTDEPLEEASVPTSPDELLSTLSPIVHDTLVREPLFVESSVDDTELRVDVYRPDGDGPYPTILVLSPYWAFLGDAKDEDGVVDGVQTGLYGPRETPAWYVDYFVPRGYAVAIGEMRGTRDSGGCWDFGGPLDQQDGHDMVEALAGQGWSNERVGMLGQSHVGMSQIATAITAPEHLTTIVPIAAVSDWYRYLHKDGAPYETNRLTPPAYFAVHASPSTEAVSPDWVLTQANTVCEDNVVHLSQSAELDGDKDQYWQERDLIAGAGNIEASVFLVHGFLDENVKTDHFLDLWRALPDDIEKRAWYGQWFHEHPAFHEWRTMLHAWFDHELMGIENGILDAPTIIVQDNLEAARAEADWPPAATEHKTWLLDGEELVPEEPGVNVGGEGDHVDYVALPVDDRHRMPMVVQDMHALRSAELAEPMRLAGEVRMTLDGELDQTAGRWIAVLLDESPDGDVDEITRLYLDARHRDDLTRGEDVPPGERIVYELTGYPRDHVVEAGHRLVLELHGTDVGCIGPATGARPTCEGTGILPVKEVVQHSVYTGSASATRLLLPVQPVESWGEPFELTELDGWLTDVPE